MTRSKLWMSICLLALGFSVPAVMGQAPQRMQAGMEAKFDYSLARREMVGFEALLDTVITTTFNAAPFALSQKTKGAYLQGYGMTFSFVVNIHRALLNTPFGQTRLYEINPEQKRKRIEDLKERLIQTLYQKGGSLKQVPKEESVTIIMFIEDRNFPDEENQNKTFILSATRKDLEELARGEDRSREFRQRMKIIEY
jgi:hypothetical protein